MGKPLRWLLHAQVRGADKIAKLRNHVIVCGAEESFHNFVEQLRRCDPMRPPVVILHPKMPRSWALLHSLFDPIHFVQVGHTTQILLHSHFDPSRLSR